MEPTETKEMKKTEATIQFTGTFHIRHQEPKPIDEITAEITKKWKDARIELGKIDHFILNTESEPETH